MTPRITPLATICILLAISLVGPLKTYASWDMTVFGDSSSDNGNVYTILLETGATPQDLQQMVNGRLTNGNNWADYVSSALVPKMPARGFLH
jgi:phospholipase/lecithinase/hemolysin